MSLETHFKNVDNAKNLLFNATTTEQEQTARRVLQKLKEEEIGLEV